MSNKTHPYLNDFWTHKVHEDYKHLCDELAKMAYEVEPPFAVAINGGWGSGKTSMLRAVMARLKGNLIHLPEELALIDGYKEVNKDISDEWEKVGTDFAEGIDNPKVLDNLKCIWFNPWQHQYEGHPMVALLHEIHAQMRMRQEFKKAGFIAAKTGLRLVSGLIGAAAKTMTGLNPMGRTNLVDTLEKDIDAYKQERFEQPLDSQRFQMHFEAAIEHLTSRSKTANANGRLVIFIDDLDRCESEQVLKLLESIKLYLSTRKCVFFFGIDHDHTVAALEAAQLGDPHQARDYLHKLFQLTVPLSRSKDFQDFIGDQLKALSWRSVFEVDDEAVSQLIQLFSETLEPNPRRIKNFLNQLMLRGKVLKSKDPENPPEIKTLGLLIMLHNYYPQVYNALEGNVDDLENICQVMVFKSPKEAASGFQAAVARMVDIPQKHEDIKPPKTVHDDKGKTEKESTDGSTETQQLETSPELNFPAAGDGHYADNRGLFQVLHRFKGAFYDHFEPIAYNNPHQILRYLQP